jgi:FrmR/RcnR family transcriptional regulator, repressor of frmRAB operon
MSHTIREKQKLLGRVKRIRGLVDAIDRAVEKEAGCDQVMHLVAGVRGAVAGLMAEVLEDHVRTHLLAPGSEKPHPETAAAADRLFEIIRTYLK